MAEQLKNMFLRLTSMELQTEQAQLQEEGKLLPAALEAEFQRFLGLDHNELLSPANQAKAGKLLDKTIALRMSKSFPFEEPSDLNEIRRLRPSGSRKHQRVLPDGVIKEHIHGAWLGRCVGCFLGKAAEGLRTDRLWPFLKDSNQWPLDGYITYGIEHLARKYPEITALRWSDVLNHMPVDDDTNYTTACLLMLKKHGADFSPVDVAEYWMEKIPLLSTFTAERIAYRNFSLGIDPPASAGYRNPYREWIGAQIRADAYGYVNAGNPERAAEFAWRDACISHVKNGIYGSMFMAALIAAAPYSSDMKNLIEEGMSEIPATCRLAEEVKDAVEWHRQGLSYDEAVERIHKKWDEYNFHHWCHTISNAVICVVALLWGEDSFGTSICRAVQAGFDTDCNGATVGSAMGMRLGTAGIAAKWSTRLNDTLKTALAGYGTVKISALAEETFGAYQSLKLKV